MIYFDNAATTHKKPDSVLKEVKRCLTKYSANPGRSGHKLSMRTSLLVYEARETVARHFNYKYPERIVFTYNATYALNIAIKGFVNEKCHVILSDLEHNSVLRPVEHLRRDLDVEYSFYDSSATNIFREIESHIRPDTRAIVTTLSSNVTGSVIPLFALSELKRKHNLILILDASQSAGHIKYDLSEYLFDAFIAPGHKALFGIMGCGICIFNSAPYSTLIDGGSGSNSKSLVMPQELPELIEAGTVAVPAISSLKAGIEYIDKIGISCINKKIELLTDKLKNLMLNSNNIYLYAAENGIISFNIKGRTAEDVACELDKHGICVRSGLHCAPLAHKKLGTYEIGCVRASLSYFNNEKEIKRFYRLIADM